MPTFVPIQTNDPTGDMARLSAESPGALWTKSADPGEWGSEPVYTVGSEEHGAIGQATDREKRRRSPRSATPSTLNVDSSDEGPKELSSTLVWTVAVSCGGNGVKRPLSGSDSGRSRVSPVERRPERRSPSVPGVGGSSVCVMCDVQQRLVNPELLLGGHESRRAAPSRAPSSGGGPQTLRVLRAVSSQGVCGSVLYGLPSILTPTACWELDWEELETNQENFHALCHCLQTRELSLLACSTGRSLSPGWGPPVLSHFMVSASDSAALLLRPVAVRELILPADVSTRTLPPRDNALRRAEDALRSLDVDPVYNPLLVTCNLYRQLQGVLTRPPMLRPQWPQPQGPMSHVTALRGTQQRGSTGGGQSRQVLLRHSKARATVAPLPLCAPSLAPLPPGTPTSDKPARRVSFLCDKEEFLSDM
ncbi:meiosis 1 arrest protein [Ascaphus truei]|uniref:meiosis 1 arrest protein n=1 Tax=Ascaphus truei TaxID=8439 RepID=UPI003F5A58E1